MPPFDAHCPWDSDDEQTGSDDESTTSENTEVEASDHHEVPYIKIESEDGGLPDSSSDSSSSSDSEDETDGPQVRRAHLLKESLLPKTGNGESEVSTQLQRENLELRNKLSKLQQQIIGVTQDRRDAEAMLEEKIREVDELKEQLRSSSSTSGLARDGSSTGQQTTGKSAALQARVAQYQEQIRQLTEQLEKKEDQYVAQLKELRLNNRLASDASQFLSPSHNSTPLRESSSTGQQANDDKMQETKSDREITRLTALLQAKEKQHQQQLSHLTKQLEKKGDQYIERLRQLRLSANLPPDIHQIKSDLAAEYSAKEKAYVEKIKQLSDEHAAKEDQLKSGLGALSSALHRKESEHQKHINQVKAERQKFQERCTNLQAELENAITTFSKEVSELKSRDPFEPVRKSDPEIQATWKDLTNRIRHFVQTYCLAVIPHVTAQELYKKQLLPGIQTICADPVSILVDPRLSPSILQGLVWEMLWTFVFSKRAEGWAGKTGQDFGEAYERASAHVASLPKDVNWGSTVAALHVWKSRSFAFLKKLRPISPADITALAYFIASLLAPVTAPTAPEQPQHNINFYYHPHHHSHHAQQPHHNYPSLPLLADLKALLTIALSLDETFRLSLANYTITFKDPATSEFRPAMMEIKPIGYTSFNAATSSQRDSFSLNDNCENAKANADRLRVDFFVSPGLLRAGDWREGGDYHQEVMVARMVVVCNADSLLRRSYSTTVAVGPGNGPGTRVNEGVQTQVDLMSKWRLPLPSSPAVGLGQVDATTAGDGHVQAGTGIKSQQAYIRTYQLTPMVTASGHASVELTSHIHNTSSTTYNHKPHNNNNNNDALQPHVLPKDSNDPNHVGYPINNANGTPPAKRKRVLHHGSRQNPGDPVRDSSEEVIQLTDSDSEYLNEPTADTSEVTTRGAKRKRRLQVLRDGVAAIVGATTTTVEASETATSTTAEAAPGTATMSTSTANNETATTETSIIFPNLHNVTSNKPNKTSPLSDLNDDVTASLEKENTASSEGVALLNQPDLSDQPSKPDDPIPLLEPLTREGDNSEDGDLSIHLSDERWREKVFKNDLVVEIPGRGKDRDFAEWQRVSWEGGLESPPSESLDRGILKPTRGGLQPTRGRGRGRPRKDSYRGGGTSRGRGRPRLVRELD
ncbi:hypothetical protein B0T20DRAFT_408092 [Sordaria brevicollis]|uniref:Uncharacterized protein n=1 Tax=Sordaria brevicollis TaxID=83679 RepID=A0AAE0PHT6_SORBR|nr:hypothetical protein B0T20DRAFT_408092 [Sordaria brevicollis]